MSILFAHSHKFRRVNGEYYSPGGLTERDIKRYVDIFGDVTIVGRVVDDDETHESYQRVSGPRVKVFDNRELERFVSEADYVVARVPSINGFRAARLAKKYGKPCLLEVVVCVWDAYWNHSLHGKFFAAPGYLYMRNLVRNATHVVYVSRKFLQKRYPTRGKQIGVSDVSIPVIDENALTKRLEKIECEEGVLALGTAGRLTSSKGQEYAIRALAALRGRLKRRVVLELVGSGDPAELRALAARLGVANDVRFLGALPHDEMFAWYDAIDVCLQPSGAEGLSRVIVEAMSRATPCVVSNAGGNPELVDEQFVFSMRNKRTLPARIADAVVKIADKRVMREQAEKNFTTAKKCFDPEKLERERHEFYSAFRDSF